MPAIATRNNCLLYKGCNNFRQRLVLSVLSGKPVRIIEVRHSADEPGLEEFEVNLIRLLDKVTNGTVVELNETGTSVYFQPGSINGGTIQHDCCAQRSIGYYLEALMMLGFFCKAPLNVTLRGVTTNQIDPSVDVVKYSMLPVLKRFVLDDEGIDLKILKRGMLPLGGGEVVFKCPIRTHLRPVQHLDSGMVKRIRGTAYALRVSPAIANRMVESAKGVLLQFIPDVYINTDQCKGKQSGNSPGFGIHLYAETTTDVIYSAESISNVVSEGQDPCIPEDVGIAAARRLCHEISMDGYVDAVSQSLAILFMALGQKDVSKLVIGPLTDYSISFLQHLREFFGITFKLEHYKDDDDDDEEESSTNSNRVLLTCVGIGFSNLSKRVM